MIRTGAAVRPHRVVAAFAVLGLVASASLTGSADPAEARRGDQTPVPSGPPIASCVVCHGSAEILDVEGADPDLYVQPSVLAESAHPDLSCQDCHGPLEADLTLHPRMLLERAQSSCAECHRGQARLLEEGAHGSSPGPRKAAAEDVGKSFEQPGCVSCHDAHDVLPAGSRTFVAQVAQRCSGCHAERGESFFDRNYHGKETRLGRHDVAVCSDCHGAHLVLPASDPRSSVSPGNVLATCRRCHPTAPPNFADIIIHVGGRPLPSDPRLMAVTLAMMVILVATFGFFGVHTALAIRHHYRSRRRPGGS